jgi:cytidylate kinase
MGVVAISQTIGSLGDDIGRRLAESLGYRFADREVIAEAAERFGEGPLDLIHVTEEKPGLLERFRTSDRHFVAAIEAILLEMAARDSAVLCGRGAAFVLSRVPHVLRVRITAPEDLRAQRVQQRDGLVHGSALNLVHQTDRERAARIKFLYHVDWDEPLRYHVVLNTEHVWVDRAVQILRATIEDERFTPAAESRQKLIDQSIVAQANVALLTNPATRPLRLFVTCERGNLGISGLVEREEQRLAAAEIVRGISGVTGVLNEIVVNPRVRAVGVRTDAVL